MQDYTGRNRVVLKLLISSLIVVAAIAVLLAWQQPTQERAEAVISGPEMGLLVSNGSTGCPGGTPGDHTCVPGGGAFTLAIEAIGIPGSGYIGAQTFIVFGNDLIYKPAVAAADEFAWLNCQLATALRSQGFGLDTVNHG